MKTFQHMQSCWHFKENIFFSCWPFDHHTANHVVSIFYMFANGTLCFLDGDIVTRDSLCFEFITFFIGNSIFSGWWLRDSWLATARWLVHRSLFFPVFSSLLVSSLSLSFLLFLFLNEVKRSMWWESWVGRLPSEMLLACVWPLAAHLDPKP